LIEVVDANKQSLASPCTRGVLKAVARRGAIAEGLDLLRRRRWRRRVASDVGVLIDSWKACV